MSMRKTVNIMGISIDKVTMGEALDRLKEFLGEDGVHTIFTPNAEILMDGLMDPNLGDVLRKSDMLVPDGAGVVLAAKILGTPLPEKVPGFDLLKNSFSLNRDVPTSYYFFGGKPGIAREAAVKVEEAYPGAHIVGSRDGYFKPEDEESIIQQINSAGPDILAVALGAPKQEKWIHANKDRLKVKVCIGVGGSFDVLAGKVQLAPAFFRNNGLEWLYRLYKEPWRFKRMMKLPKFVLTTIAYRLGIRPYESR